MSFRYLRLPPSQQPTWREAVLAAVIFGGILFLGLVIP